MLFIEFLLIILEFVTKFLIIVSNRMNIDIVSRETLKNFLNSSLLSNFDTYFFTNLSNMFAAAGVIPGSNLASFDVVRFVFF